MQNQDKLSQFIRKASVVLAILTMTTFSAKCISAWLFRDEWTASGNSFPWYAQLLPSMIMSSVTLTLLAICRYLTRPKNNPEKEE